MAAPFAAGQAALVQAANPLLTAAQVVQQMAATAAEIEGPVPLRIDAAAALGLAQAAWRTYLPAVAAQGF
jgi:subtilisin family serine protease